MKSALFKTTVMSALIFSTGSIAAGPGAEIKVTGELVASKCEVTTPGMVFDFGDKIDPRSIDDKMPSFVGMANAVTLTVNCDVKTPLTFGVTDNRLGTASLSGSEYFGLGNINGTGKLGHYRIHATNPKVDGNVIGLFATSNGTIPIPRFSILLEQGKRSGWANFDDQTLALGRTFSLDVQPEAFLAKRGDMHGGVGDDTALDGSATLEFGFGL